MMQSRKQHILLVASICLMMLLGSIVVSKPQAMARTGSVESSISAESVSGNWMMVSGIEGENEEERLKCKITFLEDVYKQKNEKFMVKERVSLQEAENGIGLKSLYGQSELYKSLITVDKGAEIEKETTFNMLSENQSVIYERYAFLLIQSAQMNLTVSYKLKQGRMAIWIVSSEEEMMYQNEFTADFNGLIDLQLEEGLYSIIFVYELDQYEVNGEKNIAAAIYYTS